MVDVACSNDHNVITEEMSWMELSELVSFNWVNIVSVSLLRLTHLMLSVNIEVSIFYQSFLISMMIVFVFLTDYFLQEFQFTWVQSAIANDISK